MPTDRIPAIGEDGTAYVVLRRTPNFPERAGQQQESMPTYKLPDGRELTPTGRQNTLRTLEGDLVLTLLL
jgi:hypothetical protein